MKKRTRRQLPDQDLGRITTFHGFCVGLLKEDCHVVQYPTTFIVLDEEDKESMLRRVFDDLIYFVLYILEQDKYCWEKWQNRLEYIMVDEFQDIDKEQYALADILPG